MDEQENNEASAWEEAYPPDPDDVDMPGMNVPTPRARQVRTGAMQAGMKRAPQKSPKLGKKGTRILAQQKRRQAVELRKAGATYQIIAEQVGYNDASAARKAVMKAYGEIIQEPVQELKTLQIERLNHMLLVLWPQVQQGDLGAMNTSLSIMNKIDHLMGTEAAREIKVQNDSAILVVDGNKDDYIKALQKMSGAGVMPDGTNMSAQQVQALPTSGGPSSTNKAPSRYPPGMGVAVQDEEIVDAEVVEDVKMSDCPAPLGTVCMEQGCPVHHPNAISGDTPTPTAVETKKKFSFGVDPTVKRKK